MFELLLVMLTITSPLLFIVLVRHYFNYKSTVGDETTVLLQHVQRKQETMERAMDRLTEQISKLEHEKRSI